MNNYISNSTFLVKLYNEHLITRLDQSVWENIDLGCGYRPPAFTLYSDPW